MISKTAYSTLITIIQFALLYKYSKTKCALGLNAQRAENLDVTLFLLTYQVHSFYFEFNFNISYYAIKKYYCTSNGIQFFVLKILHEGFFTLKICMCI